MCLEISSNDFGRFGNYLTDSNSFFRVLEIISKNNLIVFVCWGFVDLTCPNCFSQTHFASAVELEFVDPDAECVLPWRRVSCEQQSDTFQPCCQFCGIHCLSGMHLWSVF